MKCFTRLLLAFGISLLLVSALMAQYQVTISATDGSGAAGTKSLTLGTAVGGTTGIDAGLGEQELPPVPPTSVFDARFVGLYGSELGQGSAKDLRGYLFRTQTDSFLVTFQGSNEATDSVLIGGVWRKLVTFSWDNAALATTAGGSWKLIDALTGGDSVNVNMVTTGTVTLDTRWGGGLYIITTDPTMLTTVSYERICGEKYAVKPGKANSRSTKADKFAWPNVYNIGEELDIYLKANGGNPLMTVGSDPIHSVLLKKWADVYKSSITKGATHQKDSVWCLDYDHSKKWKVYVKPVKPALPVYEPVRITKQLKSLAPTTGKAVVNSFLFAQLATLKVNIAASDAQKTPAGLKTLTIGGDAPARFQGMTVAQFAAYADGAFSCLSDTAGYWTPEKRWVGTASMHEVCDLLERINKAFNKSNPDTAHLDTLPGVGWNFNLALLNPPPGTKVKIAAPKKGTMQLAGQVAVASTGFLYRAEVAPVADRQPVMAEANLAKEYRLNQNYPNPFNPTTQISFVLPTEGMVTVKVYNMLGQEIATLLDGQNMQVGMNEVTFSAGDFASGAYMYRIQVNDATGKVVFQDVKKMMLVK